LVNYALCLASGFEYKKDWQLADQVFASIKVKSKSPKVILDWWYKKLVRQDDPEGHLVVGWLARHQIVDDPDGLSVEERMQKARAGGWDVPVWMNSLV
jgi:hypothetical protein